MEKIYSSVLSSALARRTVHIKIHPTARTFSERREVLRVLERFGEVTTFRSHKYNAKNPVPSAFLSIFSDEAAAQAVVNASPVRYRLVPDAPAADGLQEKVFELNLSHSGFDHEHHIANEPRFGPWKPVERKYSFVGGGLEVPRSLMSSGLRDWETDKRKWGGESEGAEGLEELGVHSIGAKGSARDGVSVQWRIQQRRGKRLMKQIKEGAMGGLKDLGDAVADERQATKEAEDPGQGAAVPEQQRAPGFGSWPGKSSKRLLQEKATQMEMERQKGMAARDIDVGEWPR